MLRLLTPFAPHIVVALLAICGAMGVALCLLRQDNIDLSSQLGAAQAQLRGCNARVVNIEEDRRSDHEIDSRSDDDLRHAPDRWMLPPR